MIPTHWMRGKEGCTQFLWGSELESIQMFFLCEEGIVSRAKIPRIMRMHVQDLGRVLGMIVG